jgi:hypothetical protein
MNDADYTDALLQRQMNLLNELHGVCEVIKPIPADTEADNPSFWNSASPFECVAVLLAAVFGCIVLVNLLMIGAAQLGWVTL